MWTARRRPRLPSSTSFDEEDLRRVVRDLAAKDARKAPRNEPSPAGSPDWPLYDGAAEWEFQAIAQLIKKKHGVTLDRTTIRRRRRALQGVRITT